MVGISRLLLVCLCLLAGPAWAQQSSAGWFGTEMQDVTKEESDRLHWDGPHGAKVRSVVPGSPADKAGVKVGDIILSIDRAEFDGVGEYEAFMDTKRPGAVVQLRVFSSGRDLRLTAQLVDVPKTMADADVVPRLMLDTGGHMGLIRSLLFTPDGRYLVSGSDDKVVRVWDVQSGRTVRFLRGRVDAGSEGMIHAMALSPDGRWLAAGGWMKVPGNPGHVIRLYDFATGQLAALLKGHTDVVLSLAFSPDGKRLLSGSFDRTAIIWDLQSHQALWRLQGHGGVVQAVGFSPNGTQAVTAGEDKTLKLWSVATGKDIATLSGHRTKIYGLAVSPVDGTIASGSDDGDIRLWDGRTGRFLRVLGNQGFEVGSLTFARNGKLLVSTCGGGGCFDKPQIVWDVATGARIQQVRQHDGVVIATAASPDGRLVATAGGKNHQIRIWDLESGRGVGSMGGVGAGNYAVGFSGDARRIAWGNTDRGTVNSRREPFEFSLRLPAAGAILGRPERIDEGAAAHIQRAVTTFGRYELAHRKGGDYGGDAFLDLSMNGRVLMSIQRDSSNGYDHRSYGFSPDGRTIISGGSNGTLAAYDLTGRQTGEFVGHEGDVWALAPSADGRLLLSGSADQTVRLWNLESHELIATLFNGTDGEWVMWTPQGYYTGSPGADKIVGWQIDRGPANASDYVGADQLRQHLNRPDIVEKAIVLASAEEAVRESNGTSFRLVDLLSRPVPKFRIVSPAADSPQSGGRAQIKIDAEQEPDPIRYIRVQVNGRQVEEINAHIGSDGLDPGERILDVPLAKGRNDVRITFGNVVGLKTEAIVLNHAGDGDLDKRGTLYILAVGVDKYPGLGNTCGANGTDSCDLRFSGADALQLANSAEQRLAPSHSNVVRRVLVNGANAADNPTAANILDAIDVLKRAKETDTVLLFIAGHGANDGSSYRFLATNAERAGENFRSATVVPWQFLQDAIETTKGRRILFIDTCHAGNAYNQQLGNAAYHANIVAYTAARFDQEALEDARLGHGLFTYAVVEGLGGKGASKHEISTKELADYVVRRVEELAKAIKGEQEPQYFKGRDADDYVLARW